MPLLTQPGKAIVYRAEGSPVAIIEQDRIAFRTITLGRDFGTALEVRTGVSPADRVVMNPADSLVEGTAVRVVESK